MTNGKIYIKGKWILSIVALSVSAWVSGAEWNLKPGMLQKLVGSLEGKGDKELILRGEVAAHDLTSLRTLPKSVERLDMSGLSIVADTVGSQGMPSTRIYKSGELPAYMAFSTGLKEVALPESVSGIGDMAFAYTPLEKIDCRGAAFIGEGAFRNCAVLKEADMSSTSLTEIPEGLFDGCVALRVIELPEDISKIGSFAFRSTGLETLTLPRVDEIGDFAFAKTPRLADIELSLQTRIGVGAFYGASALTDIKGDLLEIPELLAAGTALNADSVLMRGPVIGSGAFTGSGLRKGVLAGNVESLADYALAGLKSLQSLDVTGLGTRIPQVSEAAFSDTDISKVRLYVLEGSAESWQQAPVWRDFIIETRESGISSPEAIATEISISRAGDDILVEADVPLESVAAYGLDGSQIISATPGTNSWRFSLPEGDGMIVIKAVAGGRVKVVKLV